MLSAKAARYGVRLALALILGLAVVGSLPIPVQAQEPIDLVLGGEGATSWNIGDIKPGDIGTKTVTAQLSHSSMFAMLAVAPVAPLIPAPEPTVPPPPKTTPAPTLGTGVWLGIGAGVAVLLALTVWLITRRHRQQSRALRRDL